MDSAGTCVIGIETAGNLTRPTRPVKRNLSKAESPFFPHEIKGSPAQFRVYPWACVIKSEASGGGRPRKWLMRIGEAVVGRSTARIKKGAGTDCSGAFVRFFGDLAALMLSDVCGLESLGPSVIIESNSTASLGQGLETLSLDRGVVYEDVIATIVLDKTVALVVVEPLYFTDCQYCSPPFRHL